MRLLPGGPISHSWLWPPVVLRALPWDGMTRQTPAGTTTPVRSAGRCRPPRPEWRTQALPEMSPALRSRRPVSRSQAAAGATADPVKDYLGQIGQVPLLTAGQEVELAKRIEAGLFAEEKLAGGSG